MHVPMYTVAKNSNGKPSVELDFVLQNAKSGTAWSILCGPVSRGFSWKGSICFKSPLKKKYINMWEWRGVCTPCLKSCQRTEEIKAPRQGPFSYLG